ncbi:SAM-dependent methyltransferase [Cupriavidus sp. SS-3]|uniref:spermine/spermidine synthase domain-containing protein n=1 Tax=Cupriavidus sp. SS-3 TaxID=3109596 RepID=UPI002DB8812F|nr:SAM-dependent methyltransferase [Cupriavidus sp. SS-3]MEC3768529.1 SAM-dependent methyltransferase [Cupriavidus sp. SS-3]
MPRPPLFALALLSAAALGYEILLMRLLSIILWHHFAYMMISVALLGYGAAGALVALAQPGLVRHFVPVFAGGALLFGISALVCFELAQRVGFNPLEILWEPTQPLRLVAIYLLLFVPFLCAATSVCLAFARFPVQVPRLYSFDILGAGLGSLGIIAALFVLAPIDALRLVSMTGMAAAALACMECRWHRPWLPALLLAAAALPAAIPGSWMTLRPSDYKELSQLLRIGDARVVAQRSSPLGLITVVESPAIPLRHAPGLSLNATAEPPPQLAVLADGDGLSALNRYDGRREPLAYLGDLTSALPYHLLQAPPRVLVLGSGAGADVLQALYHGASAVDAVELNPQVIGLVQDRFGAFSGKPYSAAGVQVHVGEARGFLAASRQRYDLIQVALLDSFSTSSAGLYALSESYLYTVEAFEAYLRHLRPGGLLAITRWVSLPPRDIPKLFATAVAAMARAGVSDPSRRLVLLRGWKTATLVVKHGDFQPAEIGALLDFGRMRSFDVEYHPGIRPGAANRYNVLDQPDFYAAAQALLGPERERFLARYKFDVRPATDDRPYFFHFFKWRTLPELISLKAQGGLPLLDWGYPVLVATLLQATAAALLLIGVPLRVLRRRAPASSVPLVPVARTGFYFVAVGLGFMFVEIAFIQKFILFLSHPLYAVAVVLCAFLCFAGLGSRFAPRLPARAGPGRGRRQVALAIGGVCAVALLYLVALPDVFPRLIAWPDPARVAVAVALIAPLGFLMGMPFPLGLSGLAARDDTLVPWAWGINACASVVAAVLATLLAIHAGFTVVVLVALLMYATAALACP